MGFWIFMLLSSEMVPALMLLFGWIFRKHPPKNINNIYGYRTSMSMKNTDTWKFAHDHCGRLWWKLGWIMLIPSFVVHIPFYHSSENTIGIVAAVLCTMQCVVLVFSVFPTEKALKRTFTEDGMRR